MNVLYLTVWPHGLNAKLGSSELRWNAFSLPTTSATHFDFWRHIGQVFSPSFEYSRNIFILLKKWTLQRLSKNIPSASPQSTFPWTWPHFKYTNGCFESGSSRWRKLRVLSPTGHWTLWPFNRARDSSIINIYSLNLFRDWMSITYVLWLWSRFDWTGGSPE